MFVDWKADLPWMIGIILGLAAIFKILCSIKSWYKKTATDRYLRKHALLLTALERVKDGQEVLEKTLIEMDAKRDSVRDVDRQLHESINDKLDIVTADVRLAVSASVTSLDGLIQLGRGSNTVINGPVLKMRDKLQDRITEGVGELSRIAHNKKVG